MSSKTGFIIIPTEKADRDPALSDRVMLVPPGTDQLEGDLYTFEEIIEFLNGQLEKRIAIGSVEVADCSEELKNFIIYGNVEGKRVETSSTGTTDTPSTPTPSTPTVPPDRTELPEAPAGIPTPIDVLTILPPDPSAVTIPVISPTVRVTPVTDVSAPAIYHPSQLEGFQLIERDGALLAHWDDPLDDGGSPITKFWVAIAEESKNIAIKDLTWIDKGLVYSHLFENLKNSVKYIAYGRPQNKAGYGYSVEARGTPVESQSKPLTLEVKVSGADYYIHADYTDGFSTVAFNLIYSEPAGNFNINEVTVENGTVVSSGGSNNVYRVVVKPNAYTQVKITVGTEAARTSLDQKIAAAVVSPVVHFRRGFANLEPPRNVRTIEKDREVIFLWDAPLAEGTGPEKLTGYQFSEDDVNYKDIPPDVFEHRLTQLTNNVEIVGYLRSKSIVGYSRPVEVRATPKVSIDVVDIPIDDLPEVPRSLVTKQDQNGDLYYQWEAPIKDNYTGFRVRINTANASPIPSEVSITEGDWITLGKDVRQYKHVSSTRWDFIQFEIQTIGVRGYSDSVKYAPAVTAFPDPLQNPVGEGGNGVIKISWDALPSTPLDDAFDPFNSGHLAYSSPQFVDIEIYKNDVLLEHTGGHRDGPYYVQAENEVEHTIKIYSRTTAFASNVVHTLTVTPSASHAVASIGTVTGLALTAGSNQLAAAWDTLTDADFYELDFSPTPAAIDVMDDDLRFKYIYRPIRVDGTSFTLLELPSGTEVTVSVRGVSENGTFGQHLEHPPISRRVVGEYATATGTPT